MWDNLFKVPKGIETNYLVIFGVYSNTTLNCNISFLCSIQSKMLISTLAFLDCFKKISLQNTCNWREKHIKSYYPTDIEVKLSLKQF